MTQPINSQPIQVRQNLDFGLNDQDIPRYWMNGDPFVTRVMDSVQSTFPDGERYFIASVRPFREKIDDPKLLADVNDFMKQEGQHGMVHTAFNNRLREQGINIDAFTGYIKKITDRRLRWLPANYNLALTAAFEHFTAMMADLFFAEKNVLAGADRRVRAMFAWHAVEEMEHRSVVFNVMQRVAKLGYFQRNLAMTHAIILFTLQTLISPWFMLKSDGHSLAARLRIYGRGMVWAFGIRRGIFIRLLPMLLRYYKPGFHPDHVPYVHNYDAWLQGYGDERDPIRAAETMYAAAR